MPMKSFVFSNIGALTALVISALSLCQPLHTIPMRKAAGHEFR